MNSFMNTLAKALPSACRPCQIRASPLRLARPFSSSPKINSSAKGDKSREMERQILDTKPEPAAEDNSPLSAITKMMQGERTRANQTVSRDYSRMAESLEAEMLKQPYADRAPPHHIHVFSTKHNTILTLTKPDGGIMMSVSCGQLGFRKAGRGGFDPGYQLAVHLFGKIQETGLLLEIQRLHIVYRNFGPGRDAFNKVLLANEGKNIRGLVSMVSDSTRIKFGGARSRHVRRLG